MLLGLMLAAACGAAAATKPSGDEPVRQFAERYCASCHGEAGADGLQPRAHAIFTSDDVSQWRASPRIVQAVLDRWHLDGKIMPPPSARAQPADDERRAVLSWLRRGTLSAGAPSPSTR
jgi:hypothetical protein